MILIYCPLGQNLNDIVGHFAHVEKKIRNIFRSFASLQRTLLVVREFVTDFVQEEADEGRI